MRRDAFHVILTIIVSLCLLCNASLAEESTPDLWYPYDIHADDSYTTASYKVSNALSGQNIERGTKYVQIKPKNYFLYGVPIEEISFMDKGETWILFISAKVTQSIEDVDKLYKLYTVISEKLGSSSMTPPKIQQVTFDESKGMSVFNTKDSFRSSLETAKEYDQFHAYFGYCSLEINVWDYYNVTMFLTFSNKPDLNRVISTETVTPDSTPVPTVASTLSVTSLPVIGIPVSSTNEPTVSPEPKREDITLLQMLLIQYGYLTGYYTSGVYDDNTATAVEDFQINNDLNITGECNEETWKVLSSGHVVQQSTVYKSRRGKVYHSNDTCSGMKTAQAMTLSEALQIGLTPCPHCN